MFTGCINFFTSIILSPKVIEITNPLNSILCEIAYSRIFAAYLIKILYEA